MHIMCVFGNIRPQSRSVNHHTDDSIISDGQHSKKGVLKWTVMKMEIRETDMWDYYLQ